jgi:hypothetical protein
MNDTIQCDGYDRCTGTQNWAYTVYYIVTNIVNFPSKHVALIVRLSCYVIENSVYYTIRFSYDQT